MDMRKHATTDQPTVYAVPTTSLSLVGYADNTTCTVCTPCWIHAQPRREVAESLERSLVEHADVWADLAER